MIRIAVASVIVFLIGCSPVVPTQDTPSDPLAGYQIMQNPRSSVPLGAIWINDIGPNGNGVVDTEIERFGGVDSFVYTSHTNASMTAKLAKLFGISGAAAKTVSFTLQGIEIYRVKDVFLSKASAGENVLYEAIKAKSVSVELASGGTAEIGAQLEAKGIPFVVGAGAGGGKWVSVDGSNLFIAFRVVTFAPLDYGRSNVLVDGWATDFFISTNGYRIKGDATSIQDCACEQGNDLRVCLEQPIILKITEPSGMSIGGMPSEMTIAHRPSVDWDKNYTLWKRTEKELPSGTVYRTRYLSLDLRKVMSVEHMPQISSEPECSVRISPGGSGGEVVEMYYEVRSLAQPRGW